jgi:tetratricopeptide (TPR) repeat protein
VPTDTKRERPSESPDIERAKKKKKKSVAELQRELRDLSTAPQGAEKPPIDLRRIAVRAGLMLGAVWLVAIVALAVLSPFVTSWARYIPLIVAGALTVLAVVAGVWFSRWASRSRELGDLLRAANATDAGRKEALRKLETDYKKGDVQATIARAQLEMQDDPRRALATLEGIDLARQLTPLADQVRCLRATIHLQLGELQEARALVDKMELGKQQDVKTRAMFAAVVGEAWGRTGQGKKAVELLDVFNPDDPEYTEMRVQMWRARAFANAGVGDMKAASRALKKLAEVNPQLLGMFLGTKRIHPMLGQEARQILMRSGAVPRKMVRQKM